ncbi:hypothetical protein AURDEDRAFT_187700, partial [Auricularia subglabra TFB-10046 SS5]
MEDPLASTSMDVDLGLTPADFLLPDVPEPALDVPEAAPPPPTAADDAAPADPTLAALPFADAAIPPSVNPLKRPRSASPAAGDATEAKRAKIDYTNPAQVKLTEAERRAVLGADPIARTVESNRVFCVECKKWVKLGDGVRFRIKHWAGHCALVHKRDKETAGRIVEQGIKDAAEAAALKAAGLLVEEPPPPPPPVMDDKNKPKGNGRWPNSTVGKGVVGKKPFVPGGPPVTRSTYETRATGKPSIPDPRLPVRYNYEDEIPEPYDFSDSDKTPPPPLPPRMRKSHDWFGRHTTHGLDALRRRFAGEPAACAPPHKLSARELRAQVKDDPAQPGVFFLRPRDLAGRRPGQYWEVVPRQEVVPLPGGKKGRRIWIEDRAGVVIQPTNVRNIEPIDVTDYPRRERVQPANGDSEQAEVERVLPVGDITMDLDLDADADADADAEGEEDALGSPDGEQLEYVEDEVEVAAGDESIALPEALPAEAATEEQAAAIQELAAEGEPAPAETLIATQEDSQNTAVVPVPEEASAATLAAQTSAVAGLEDVQPEDADVQPEAADVQLEAAEPQASTSAPEVIPPTPPPPADDEDQWMGLKPPPLSPSISQPTYSLMIEDFMSPVGTRLGTPLDAFVPSTPTAADKGKQKEVAQPANAPGGFIPRV